MDELLGEYERITNDITEALRQMDPCLVSKLVFQQYSCLDKIVRKVAEKPDAKNTVIGRLVQLQPVIQRNTLLLENAMTITNELIEDSIAKNNVYYDQRG